LLLLLAAVVLVLAVGGCGWHGVINSKKKTK
jgi:hypothetical protein